MKNITGFSTTKKIFLLNFSGVIATAETVSAVSMIPQKQL
jgi:hypothetical protein